MVSENIARTTINPKFIVAKKQGFPQEGTGIFLSCMRMLLMTAVLLASLCSMDDASKASAASKWDIYMYVCGSDLESEGGAWADAYGNILLTDIPEGVRYTIKFGGSESSQDSFFQEHVDESFEVILDDTDDITSYTGPYEDMGDGSTLEGFLQDYTAEETGGHRGLILWNHGSAINGLCYDEKTDNMITLNELQQAFKTVYPEATPEKPAFDFIWMDACLMANIEALKSLKGMAHYVIASEEITYSGDYSHWVKAMCSNPDISPDRLSTIICNMPFDFVEGMSFVISTYSVVDMTQLPQLEAAYGSYTKALLEEAKQNTGLLARLSQDASLGDNYGGNNPLEGYMNMIDVYGLAENTQDIVPAESQALMAAIDRAVYVNNPGKARRGSHGISMYYPLGDTDEENQLYRGLNVADPSMVELCSMLEKEDFDISPLSGLEITTLPDERFQVQLPLKMQERITAVDAGTYRIDSATGKRYFLGSDDRVDIDLVRGTVTDTLDTDWLTLNGHFISPVIYSYNDHYALYSAPVRCDGDDYVLRFVQDYDTGEFYATGMAELTEDGTSGLVSLPARGEEVTILNQLCDGDKITLEEGDTFTLEDDVMIYPAELPVGEYERSFLFRNPKAETAETGTVPFAIEEIEEVEVAEAA